MQVILFHVERYRHVSYICHVRELSSYGIVSRRPLYVLHADSAHVHFLTLVTGRQNLTFGHIPQLGWYHSFRRFVNFFGLSC